jgi:pyridoxamine 5'-phosphate oxidase
MRSAGKSGRRVAASESAARRECPFSAPRPGRETGRVDVTDLDGDPLRQLSLWLDAARAAGQPMPEAMTIATATSDGVPSARLVVLRGLRRGLVFFTDCESEKGADLAANPRAAAVLHWLVPVHRQVRVAGRPSGWARTRWTSTGAAAPPPSVSARPPRGKAASSPARRSWKRRPGHPAGSPRRSRCSPAAALGRFPGAAIPRRVLAGITGRPARPDSLPHGRQRLDHRAAITVTVNGPGKEKLTTKPPGLPPAATA